jgi:heat-inducible transcriptional repressor
VVSLVRDLIAQGASVRIGNENEMVELKECSLVIAPYRVEGELAGTLAVLGPTRMNYPQTMAAVSAVSRRLTKHLST